MGLRQRRGYFFFMDALLAAAVIITAVVMTSTNTVQDTASKDINHLAQDSINALAELQIKEVQDISGVQELIDNGNITEKDMNRSVLEMVTVLWAEGQDAAANNLSEAVLGPLTPPGYSYGLFTHGEDMSESISVSNHSPQDNVISYQKFVSGVEHGAHVRGYLTKLYFEKIQSKKTSAYTYFGGFIGQGDITAKLHLPANVNESHILEVWMELNTGDDFELEINGDDCGTYHKNSGGGGYLQADRWDITEHASSLGPGENTIELDFDDINKSYLGGGYIMAVYESRNYSKPNMRQEGNNLIKTRHIPGVDGIVNIYDGFHVPGELNSMDVHLEYTSNNSGNVTNTFYMTIGNRSVYEDNSSSGKQEVNLTPHNLSNRGINLSALSGRTVPYRIGYQNVSFEEVVPGTEGIGDAVLVTDLSGSMGWNFTTAWSDGKYANSSHNDCNNLSKYNDPDVSRIFIARCVDKQFSYNMLNASEENRVGLTSYNEDLKDSMNLTNNYTRLKNQIESYEDGGNTCTACGVWKGINMLTTLKDIIPRKDTYRYLLPGNNPGENWTHVSYNDSSWENGTAILGFGPDADTPLPAHQLWLPEKTSDYGPPVDFTSGVNSSNNTFQTDPAYMDGWDWENGTYVSGDDDDAYREHGHSSGEIYARIGGTGSTLESPASAAWGVDFIINSTHMEMINNGTMLYVTFDYRTDDLDDNLEEDACVLARISNASSHHYLGSESTNSWLNAPSAVWCKSATGEETEDTFQADITPYVTGEGYYYLDFGVAIEETSVEDEGIRGSFDDVSVFLQETGPFLFRKEFHLDSLTEPFEPTVHVRSDDHARVYLNGNLIDDDTDDHDGTYWNREIELYMEAFFSDDMESTNGWTHNADQAADDLWERGEPEGSGAGGLTIDEDHSEAGTEAWCFPLNGSANIGNGDTAWLISPAITTPDSQTLHLNYYTAFDFEYNSGGWSGSSSEDRMDVYVSTNGTSGPWERIDQLEGMNDWELRSIPLFDHGDETIRLKFDYQDLTASGTGSKVCIDDMTLSYKKDASYLFNEGDNVIAVNLSNDDGDEAEFDLSVKKSSERKKAMLIMSDGKATDCTDEDYTSGSCQCPNEDGNLTQSCTERPSIEDAAEQVVDMACWAKAYHNVSIYTVVFGDDEDGMQAMNLTAQCDNASNYYQSDDADALSKIYTSIADDMRTAWGTYHKQTLHVGDQLDESELYADSYLRFNVTPYQQPSDQDIVVTTSTEAFNNSITNGTLHIPSSVKLLEVMVSSYSEEYWTANVSISNGSERDTVFNLGRYAQSSFSTVGDPFMVGIPPASIQRDTENEVRIHIGANATNYTEASPSDRAFLTFAIESTHDSQDVGGESVGCAWNLTYYDDTSSIVEVPSDYSGSKTCYYHNATYDKNDSIDIAAYRLFNKLDFKNDSKLIVKPEENLMTARSYSITNVPSMIGPSYGEVRVWK